MTNEINHYSLINSHLRLRRDGDDRVRTDGLRSASAALSQLSYIPLPVDPCSRMGFGRGDVAQLGERRTCTAEAVGSNPIISTAPWAQMRIEN